MNSTTNNAGDPFDNFMLVFGNSIIEGMGNSRLDPMASDLEFLTHYQLKMDGKILDFSPEGYPHLEEVYLDSHLAQVLMAGAQTGKSVRVMVRLARAMIEHWGSAFGYFFPDFHLPAAFSNTRFAPFLKGAPELAPWVGRDGDKKKSVDQVFTRAFGASMVYFLSVAGKTATEGLPMKGVFFDEVRRMMAGDVQRAEERTAAQRDPVNFKVSTARYPDNDIHKYFKETDQRHFHSLCSCPDGVCLALTFPNCVAELKGATPELRNKIDHAFFRAGIANLGMTEQDRLRYGEAVYICPRCGDVITNPRLGWWEPHNPGVYAHGYQLPQMLNPVYTAARALQKYQNAPDIMEVYNSLLGLPYLDPNAVMVNEDHLKSCVNLQALWAFLQTSAWRRKFLRNCSMGIDAMGGYNVIVVKQLTANHKYRTVHLEIAQGDDPWQRCAELMILCDVSICVADCEPHYNEAHRFAKRFEGRVFLATYAGPKADLVSWGDRVKTPEDQRKAGQEASFKHTVLISRFRGLKWSLSRWKQRLNETPDPAQLIQQLPQQGGKVVLTAGWKVGRLTPTRICQDVYWYHMQSVAFGREPIGDDGAKLGNYRDFAEHINGIDPHFAHANLYADVALSRIGNHSPTG